MELTDQLPLTPALSQGERGLNQRFLKGDRAGQWSLRINDQWRLCFASWVAMRSMSRLSITIEEHDGTIKNGMRPVHPGEILREDFLKPPGMSTHALSVALHVPPARINDIVRERRGVMPDTALRLARHFGGDAKSWLNLQAEYDLKIAAQAAGKDVDRQISPRAV